MIVTSDGTLVFSQNQRISRLQRFKILIHLHLGRCPRLSHSAPLALLNPSFDKSLGYCRSSASRTSDGAVRGFALECARPVGALAGSRNCGSELLAKDVSWVRRKRRQAAAGQRGDRSPHSKELRLLGLAWWNVGWKESANGQTGKSVLLTSYFQRSKIWSTVTRTVARASPRSKPPPSRSS